MARAWAYVMKRALSSWCGVRRARVGGQVMGPQRRPARQLINGPGLKHHHGSIRVSNINYWMTRDQIRFEQRLMAVATASARTFEIILRIIPST